MTGMVSGLDILQASVKNRIVNLNRSELRQVIDFIDKINPDAVKPYMAETKKLREPGGLSGRFWMSDDFDEPMDFISER